MCRGVWPAPEHPPDEAQSVWTALFDQNGGGAADTPCIGYPIRSRGAHSRAGKDRVALEPTNLPIARGRVRDEPGDLVAADDSCAVVVPRAPRSDVLRTAEEIVAKEDPILRDVRAEPDPAEARRRHRPNTLRPRGAWRPSAGPNHEQARTPRSRPASQPGRARRPERGL